MNLELDHIFCFFDPLLPEVEVLEREGFILTSGRRHVGQGTANRSIMFESNYLELIYLDSEKDAILNPLKLHLRSNWKASGKSPFGIALRGEVPDKDLDKFWDYSPPYAPELKIKIHHFNELHPEFPLLFVMPTTRLSSSTRFKELPLHKTGSTNISKIIIGTPSREWPLSSGVEGIKIEKGVPHNIQVQVNGLKFKSIHLNELMDIAIVPN
jgi:hypothetical protein